MKTKKIIAAALSAALLFGGCGAAAPAPAKVDDADDMIEDISDGLEDVTDIDDPNIDEPTIDDIDGVTDVSVVSTSGPFTMVVYTDPEASEYKELSDISSFDTSGSYGDSSYEVITDRKVRVAVDQDDVELSLEFLKWDFDRMASVEDVTDFDEFCDSEDVLELKTVAGQVYEFDVFEGETFPYFRIKAEKGDQEAEFDVLPDLRDGDTVFTIVSSDDD